MSVFSTAPMRVLITGATGSLGSTLMRRLLSDPRTTVICFSRDELKQAELRMRLAEVNEAWLERARFFLGDVRDPSRLREAMRGVNLVVHAAALKRVDAVAYSPEEVVKTNVLGTINVVRAATEAFVKKVLVISSDKAVEPANIYGASKLMAEFNAVQANALAQPAGGTRISCLRYGNVTGSRGSVVLLWKRQILAGRPMTVTDPSATRFWLTLDDAVTLVLAALDTMEGGEVFLPSSIGSYTVDELAWACARVFGKPECGRELTGMRPGGEKRHESLVAAAEEGRFMLCARPELGAVLPAYRSWLANYPERGHTSDRDWVFHLLRSSSTEQHRMTVDQLAEQLADLPEVMQWGI